ncbi:hypothetical protein EVAR_46525_1 [Eumeta japonica]|uniref:Uncharacterized protein n=1 Tax=Eumeta variegata TaxID=151549 RepID=A0A4C1WV92_EUMVA|nr:hypothetical protein EVAR_46525_1 [Eumeta japonica]
METLKLYNHVLLNSTIFILLKNVMWNRRHFIYAAYWRDKRAGEPPISKWLPPTSNPKSGPSASLNKMSNKWRIGLAEGLKGSSLGPGPPWATRTFTRRNTTAQFAAHVHILRVVAHWFSRLIFVLHTVGHSIVLPQLKAIHQRYDILHYNQKHYKGILLYLYSSVVQCSV